MRSYIVRVRDSGHDFAALSFRHLYVFENIHFDYEHAVQNANYRNSFVAHEMGHLVFNKLLSETVPELTEVLNKASENYDDSVQQAKSTFEMNQEFDSLFKSVQSYILLIKPYNEVFADLFAVVWSRDENIISKSLEHYFPKMTESSARNFNNKVPFKTNLNRDIYSEFAEIRQWIGVHLLSQCKNESDRLKVLNRVARVFIRATILDLYFHRY